MQTVHLDPNMVPPHLKAGYSGRMFKARVTESMTIPSMAGIWDGGSRETYKVVRLSDGQSVEPIERNSAPWDNRRVDIPVQLGNGIIVVSHSIFCGKDMGLTFWIHPTDAAPMLPKPVDLTADEKTVLEITRGIKSSYRADEYRRSGLSVERVKAAQDSLKAKGFVNAAGAITVAGKNAIPSRY